MKAYMCKVDWEHDFPDSNDPVKIFANLDDLVRHAQCADECGIVELDVSISGVVLESDFFGRRGISLQDAVRQWKNKL